jgi:Dolichyl-phosphate-mannose-protein mannosyltransferase
MAKKKTFRGASAQTAVLSPKSLSKNSWADHVGLFLRRHSLLIAIGLILIGSLRIVATYIVFNHTIDEPAHIACGMEWLSSHTYHYETQHPPLARVMTALGPYLAAERSWHRPLMYNEGAAILYTSGHYDRVLELARLGILPFFWLGALVVFWWARRLFGEIPALVATFLFTFTPAILAHGGLATTDMALTATFGAAFLTGLTWLENPSWKWTAILGVALAAAVLSKFSFLVFFPASVAIAAVVYWAMARPRGLAAFVRARMVPLGCALLFTCLLVWAGYRFSFDKVPAPELFQGIGVVVEHNTQGHLSFLLGKYSESGFWYYYPVVLAMKTPLPLLGLAAIGLLVCWKRGRQTPEMLIPAAFAAGVLTVGVFSRINIGVRHMLPVYISLAILGAAGAWKLWASGRIGRWILGALMLWMVATSAFSHPDYLAYFNVLAGDEPENVLVDSDLDWGQDMKRLSARLHELGATEVAFDPFIVAHLEAVHGFPPIKPLDPNGPLPGWNAVSVTMLKLDRMGLKREHPEYELWTARMKPQERVGKSVLLYYVPPASR